MEGIPRMTKNKVDNRHITHIYIYILLLYIFYIHHSNFDPKSIVGFRTLGASTFPIVVF